MRRSQGRHSKQYRLDIPLDRDLWGDMREMWKDFYRVARKVKCNLSREGNYIVVRGTYFALRRFIDNVWGKESGVEEMIRSA